MYVVSDMMRVSLAQLVLVAIVTVIFAIFVGQDAAYSALIGGLAYAIPSGLLALYLVLMHQKSTIRPNPYRILIGEFLKIFMVLLILGLTVKYYENLYWPALIISIIVVANSYFIVLFKRN